MTSSVLSSSAGVLAYIPSPARGVWEIGPFPLRAYALFIIIGIVVAIYWGERRWIARGGEPGTVLDIAVWAVPFGLIGGRIYHVMTDWPSYFGEGKEPLDALKIWQGGLGIWGAVFFGGLGAWIGCRRRGIPLPAFGDAIAPPILLAQAIGRLGNYFNQELYGRVTDVPWGLEIYERRNAAGVVDSLGGESTGVLLKIVHPTFLYEMIWNLVIVILLVLVDRRFKIGHGRLFALYVAGYCAGRFCVELMRDDPASHIGGIRINSFTSAIVFVLAVAYVVFAKRGREEPTSLLSKKERQRRLAADTSNADVDADLIATDSADDASAAVVDAPDEPAPEADAAKADVGEDPADPAKVDAGESARADIAKADAGDGVTTDVAKVEAGRAANADVEEGAEADAANADAGEDTKAPAAKAEAGKAEKVDVGKAAKVDAAKTEADKDSTVDAAKVEGDKADSTVAVNPEAAEPDSGSAGEKSDEQAAVATEGAAAEAESSAVDAEETKMIESDDDVVVAKPLGSLVERNSRRMRAVWQRRGRR